MTDQVAPNGYTFGRYELQPAERRLLVDGEPTTVGSRAFDVLVTLVERAGRLVTKDELLDLVWPNLVVEENNLQAQVSALRKLLGRDAIVTIQGTGYRFALVPQRVTVALPAAPEIPKHNLPQQLTRFIGREKEIAEVRALMARTRLLTLTGSGGSGKTRLSLQMAASELDVSEDGVWFVELAALAEVSLVPQTLATTLGVKEVPGTPMIQTLTAYLQQKRLLLILDNCEHLLDACARVADAILRQCPNVTILASSREALGIDGEQTYRVPSLSLPDRKEAQTPQTILQCESAQLFIDRALLVRTDFAVTRQNAPALSSLCHHLDGIPLAIELAAARVRTLAVEEIDSKLDERFGLLIGSSRTALPRHQTLRALIDWSYDLLHEPERLLLQRLSVFAGGWTLRAAEEICAGDGIDDRRILNVLTSLSDKSLVVAEERGGKTRYGLIETMRQYAGERLIENGRVEVVRERHQRYFLALAKEAEPHLRGSTQALWMQRLEEDYENLRASLSWSLGEANSSEGGVGICGALMRFWLARGLGSEGREFCARALEKAGGKAPNVDRAKALNTASVLAIYQGDFSDARSRSEENLAVATLLQDRLSIANALNTLALVDSSQGQLACASARLEECLTILRDLGDQAGIMRSLLNLGSFEYHHGEYAAARVRIEDGLAIARQLGDRSSISLSLKVLGRIARREHDYAAARALQGECLAIYKELGYRGDIAQSLSDLGDVALDEENYPTARALHHEALTIGHEIGSRQQIAESLEGVAAVIAALGEPIHASLLWGSAERLREEIGSVMSPNERSDQDRRVAKARALLEDEIAFDRAWLDGRALTIKQATDLARALERG